MNYTKNNAKCLYFGVSRIMLVYEFHGLRYKAYKEALSNSEIFHSFSSELFTPALNIVYSKYTLGAQLADFVAGTVFSFYENKNNKETRDKIRKLTLAYGKRVYRKDDDILGVVVANRKLI